MKLVRVLLPLAAAGLIMGTASARDMDGFYGKVEQMPTAEIHKNVTNAAVNS